MLALIYFALAACVGDFLCRRLYQFQSVAHRCAAAILVGVMISSWFTYLAGLAFFWTSQPLVWANLLFCLAAIAVLSWPKWKARIVKGASSKGHLKRSNLYLPRPAGSGIADWLIIIAYVVLVSWMMFASFNSKAGKLQIANPEYSDFGPNTALIQSFAVGHNFPTEYPHFSGDRIRYHFLFFFFFGSLSYVPFLRKQTSVRGAIEVITHVREYLPTIFPYRGDAWGTWSQVTYLNQRHFASALGIPLLVLTFLVIRYRAFLSRTKAPT